MTTIISKVKEVLESKKYIKVLRWLGILFILLVTFQVGVFVGFHKAAASYKFGEGYYKTFGHNEHDRSGLGRMSTGRFSEAHGNIGKILKIEPSSLVIEGKDGLEKVIRLDSETEIRRFRDKVVLADLNLGEFVVVIGEPNSNAEIIAKFIRILPPDVFGSGSVMNVSTSSTSTMQAVIKN